MNSSRHVFFIDALKYMSKTLRIFFVAKGKRMRQWMFLHRA